jgi:2-phospho-L-lactate transferase/gluconeogenesis factor (CofD/UPF0052 family)
VKRARPSSVFNFQSASVGNLFLTAARLFTGSFESAIYLLGSITGVPSNVSVVPAINSNFSHHIAAGLTDGSCIVGQNAISHPSIPTTIASIDGEGGGEAEGDDSATGPRITIDELHAHDTIEDANLPGSLPTLRKQNISFHKDLTSELPSRIERIWYINPYGQEIRPSPNPKVIDTLTRSQAVIYSIGSLYTSIVPCLVLKDVGEILASPTIRSKILILNGSIDRETGPAETPYSAKDFIAAIAGAGASSRGLKGVPEREYRDYVTHVVHLEGEGTPKVDREELKRLGIEAIRIYGRKREGEGGGMLYDGKALEQTLEAVLGRRDVRADQSRRNTLQN